MIGAKPAEIALATNTTFGINLAAFSLPLKRGDVVLSPDLEFPANVYPWMQLAERRGIEYRRLECDDGVLHRDRLERELEDERVKLVTVSWVQFASGARVDLAALGALCHERGVYFVVDAIQGLGPLTLDMSKTHVDILACGAQKWLLSPWGAAFVYVRQPLIEQLEPHDVSWMSVEGSDDFTRLTNYDLKWRQDARRFEFVTLPYQDYAGMNASLELFAGDRICECGAMRAAARRADRELGGRARRRRAGDAGGSALPSCSDSCASYRGARRQSATVSGRGGPFVPRGRDSVFAAFLQQRRRDRSRARAHRVLTRRVLSAPVAS